ncbi:STAS domain-containing protein [Aneurinibacillus sp. Ricciae_BoGa-3]|uniref:STAS domain-containing protein n=1 Tax=Aneurinibacillus sp. Ricciae_BoGa-3 TaxID=3022697 RepID=UPI00233FC4C7|nr:STAS domain-containing protein [Aneurinibacillus sp. Ricciae_BoGa-3]WCK53175.1 STAS domain-containing protein [Aneurinibacillus sp. Ricciae_BoGa-3]
MNLNADVANYLIDNRQQIAQEIIDTILSEAHIDFSQDDINTGLASFEEFLRFLGEAILRNDKQPSSDLMNWSHKNGEREASTGKKITFVLESYSLIRDAFQRKIYSICKFYNVDRDVTFDIITNVDRLIDVTLHETIKAFDAFKDRILVMTKEEVSELSAPIVPVDDGIAVLPIIGQIDTYRAKNILEKTVPKVAELKVEHLIIDFSGIQAVDTMVVDHLFKINNVLRLLGIDSTITGIRPEIARTTVQMGIDLSSIKTFATVRQALKFIRQR